MKSLVFLLAITAAYAQTAPTQPAPAAPAAQASPTPAPDKLQTALVSGTPVKTVLTKAVIANESATGQEIAFKTVEEITLADGTKIPANSKLVAKVFDVKSKAKGDPLTVLALTLASIQSKDGSAVPVHGNVQAFAPPEAKGAEVTPGSMTEEQRGGGSTGARVDPNEKIGNDPESPSAPVLSHNHVGSGIQNVQLLHGFVGETLVSALRSTEKNFKLPANAQFVFRVSK